jgi:hypothetical protein
VAARAPRGVPAPRVERAMIPSSVREFLEAMRLRGVRWAAWALFRRFVFSFRRAYLFWNPIPAVPASDHRFEHRLAERGDLDRLTVFEPYVVRSRMRRWLESEGTWVFLALDGDRPVAFECNSVAAASDPILPSIALARHQAWTDEIYVVPEYRRRHVSLGLRQYRSQVMQELGFTEVVSKVDEENYASLRRTYSVLARSGRVRRITCLCVLGVRWRWIEENGRQLLEARLARCDAEPTAARDARSSRA